MQDTNTTHNKEQQGQGAVGTWLIVAAIIVLAGGAYLYYAGDYGIGNGNGGNGNGTGTTTQWRLFTSEEYDFSLQYPMNWQFASTTEEGSITPLFNAYAQQFGVTVPDSITHHSNISNVSVFPEGIPTEGLFGETEAVDFETSFTLSDDSRMYVLDDGTPFAAYLKPETVPTSWGEAGFVWMRVYIDNLETQCLDADGIELSEEQCDPLMGDHTIRWSGTVDETTWERELEMVQNIQLGL